MFNKAQKETFIKEYLKFVPETEVGFGFRVHEQAIYIDKDDVVSYEVDDGRIAINGSRMTIKIISRT